MGAIFSDERIFEGLYFTSCCPKDRKQFIKGLRILIQRLVNRLTDLIPMSRRLLISKPDVIALPMRFWILNYGQLMLHTDLITQTADGKSGVKEVSEFSFPIQRRGVPDDMVVNMSFVYVGRDNKSVPAFQKATGKLIADFVCVFRRDLSGLEGVTHRRRQDIYFV